VQNACLIEEHECDILPSWLSGHGQLNMVRELCPVNGANRAGTPDHLALLAQIDALLLPHLENQSSRKSSVVKNVGPTTESEAARIVFAANMTVTLDEDGTRTPLGGKIKMDLKRSILPLLIKSRE